MGADPAVLVSLRAGDVRDRLVGWVQRQGFRTHVTEDARDTVVRLRTRPFEAAFLESEMAVEDVGTVWRVVHRIVGHRLVLMAWERRNELWFEALGVGVRALLPLPPEEASVRAALDAALGTRRFLRGC